MGLSMFLCAQTSHDRSGSESISLLRVWDTRGGVGERFRRSSPKSKVRRGSWILTFYLRRTKGHEIRGQ